MFKRDIYTVLKPTVKMCGLQYKLIDLGSIVIISPRFEPYLWRYLKPGRGQVFIDVGAHIGKYTLIAARLVGGDGVVVAVEPNPEALQALHWSIHKNRLGNVYVVPYAAWDSDTVLEFYVREHRGHSGAVGVKGLSRVVKRVAVKAVKLDEVVEKLNLRRVDVVKVDVEGAEVRVVRGALNTLRRFKPRLVVECWHRNREELLELLSELGYRCIELERHELNSDLFCLPK